jgi:hypothetical protein
MFDVLHAPSPHPPLEILLARHLPHRLHWSTFVRHRQYSISHAGSGICLANWKRGQSRFEWQRQRIPDSEPTWGRIRLEAPEIFRSTGQPGQLSIYYGITSIRFEPRSAAARHFKGLLSNKAPGSYAIYIPHWLIIATFLLPWSAFLICRSRRIHHLTKATA